MFRTVFAILAITATMAAASKPFSKVDFFRALKTAKREALVRDLKLRGCAFRLDSTEEATALEAGADFGVLNLVKMNYRKPGDPVPPHILKSQKTKPATTGSAPPRTPRTPSF